MPTVANDVSLTEKSRPYKALAGRPVEENDPVLTSELLEVGIPVVSSRYLIRPDAEVKSSVMGELHGWSFTRGWNYWICSGPGIEVNAAEQLYLSHGHIVRADGGGGDNPRELFRGLACNKYHVDTPEGLAALVATLNNLVNS